MGKLAFTRLVLSQILEKLELREIPSVSKMPRTSAACLHNIKKCLAFLREQKAKVDPNNLYCEQEVLEGNPVAISRVIDEIYKAYAIAISKLDRRL